VELLDGKRLVVAELVGVPLHGLPVGAVGADVGIVGDDCGVRGCIFADEVVEHLAQHELQSGADDVEGDGVVAAELVEHGEAAGVSDATVTLTFSSFCLLWVHLENFLHHGEFVFKWHIGRRPELFRYVAKGALASVDLLVELVLLLYAAAKVVEEDVASVPHEDCAIEVCYLSQQWRRRQRRVNV
jgi:hypothetical protein